MPHRASGIRRRSPFPGIRNFSADPEGWARLQRLGGIWISPGNDENEIAGNTFDEITTDWIVIEGDHNMVVTRSATDSVRDPGSANRVSGPGYVTSDRSAPFLDESGESPARRAVRVSLSEKPGKENQMTQRPLRTASAPLRHATPREHGPGATARVPRTRLRAQLPRAARRPRAEPGRQPSAIARPPVRLAASRSEAA